MGLKLLHSADWHLDAPLSGLSGETRQQLRSAQQTIPGKIADLCRREQCDLVLLAGDLFDRSPSRDTVDLVKSALAHCIVPVFISPGNHDYCTPDSPWLREQWPENVHIFTGGLESVAVEQLNCRVWGGAFQSMDCPGLLDHFRADCREPYAVAVLHGDPSQANSPYNPITAAQVRDSGLDYLALGHIHKAGSFRSGSALCAWPGCPMGRGWDETGEKGVYLVTLEPDAAQLQSVSLGLPCFREFDAPIAGDARKALESVLPPMESGDYFRITLTGQGYADIPALLREFPHIPNLELIDRTEAPLDIWGETDSDTLEGVYFRMLQEKLTAASARDAHMILQAAEISRRILEGREVHLP